MTNLFMEEPIQFICNGTRLFGILHVPENHDDCRDVIIMVTGGPQTRYGSHRLYVQLARFLCERGVVVFRFDYEGMGDSGGEFVGAEYSEPSIHAAVQYIDVRFPEKNRKIIWSLCDGATESALYASRNSATLSGLILCNPYVHDELVLYKKHYYRRRLFDKDFWIRFLDLKIDFKETVSEIIEFLRISFIHGIRTKFNKNMVGMGSFTHESFLRSLQQTRIPIYCILSSNDDVAREFHDKILGHKTMKELLKNGKIKIFKVNGADHTFTAIGNQKDMSQLTVMVLHEMGFAVLQK